MYLTVHKSRFDNLQYLAQRGSKLKLRHRTDYPVGVRGCQMSCRRERMRRHLRRVLLRRYPRRCRRGWWRGVLRYICRKSSSSSPEVNLPRHVDAEIEVAGIDRRRCQRCHRTCLATLGISGTERQLGIVSGTRHTDGLAGHGDAANSHAHVIIAGGCLGDERIEEQVAELMPPCVIGRQSRIEITMIASGVRHLPVEVSCRVAVVSSN